MALFMNRVGPFSTGFSKLCLRRCHAVRLCFRSGSDAPLGANWRHFPFAGRVTTPVRFRSSASAAVSVELKSCQDVPMSPPSESASRTRGLWVDRGALHSVLERTPDFQETIFRSDDFQHYSGITKQWHVLHPTKEDFEHATPSDLMEFLHFHTASMGREDFREACSHISGCLPKLTDDELLEMAKVLYLVPYRGGNLPLIWTVLDQELLDRFSSNFLESSEEQLDFFTRVMDVIYWLDVMKRSSFADCFLRTALSQRTLRYPTGVQLLLYVNCYPREWRSKVDYVQVCSFLNNIKYRCPFDVFLVAAECFTFLQFKGTALSTERLKSVELPKTLQYFLLSKAVENINDDNVLTVISELVYSCSWRKIELKPFLTLLEKIIERGQVSFLVFYYLLQTAVNSGIKYNKFLMAMDDSLIVDKVHPRALIRIFLDIYGTFGRGAVANLAKRVDHELKSSDICTLSEGHLLKIFAVLMDCEVKAYHLWELTMQGDFLVPNFIHGHNLHLNSLHLTADDCIEVYCPNYSGSRLSDLLRMQIYLENCKSASEWSVDPFQNFAQDIQKIIGGHGVVTHILPGLTDPCNKDVVVCVDDDRGLCYPCDMGSVKPWQVKKAPTCSAESGRIFALWPCCPIWAAHFGKLKHNAIQRLGYISIMVDTELWTLPRDCRDEWIYSRLGLSRS